jgi:diguanylate cyclase (GGDEF)-like protein
MSTIGLKVLLVEDDDDTRVALARAIRGFGHTCETAKDGKEAWEIQSQAPADAIISDWAISSASGQQLCEAVRLQAGSHYTRFIFATAKGQRDDVLRGLRMGADDYLVKPLDLELLELRLAAVARVVAHERLIAQRNVRLRRESERFRKAAHVDALTNLGNRLQLDEDMQEIRRSMTVNGGRWTVAICDIDWFKAYNDHYGHLRGDRALTAVGRILAENMRSGDRCYRYGGEEFLILLRDHTNAQAMAAVERVRHDIESLRLEHAASPFGVLTISIGLAHSSPAPAVDIDNWLARADAALYVAKAQGRNCVIEERSWDATLEKVPMSKVS